MARKAALMLAVVLLALVAVMPAAGAQQAPYEEFAPIVEEQPAVIVPAPGGEVEEVGAVVRRPADVDEVQVLAATGFGLTTGLVLSMILLSAGVGFVLLARRRRRSLA